MAGESSGDLLGAGLIGALRERYPAARFEGIGGPAMLAAGFEAWYRAEELAVMGYVEVLRHLPRLLAIRRAATRRALAARPDAFIGIDAPDFNLGLETTLKRAGIATVHYVSPSVWAWKEKRAARIGQSADRVLCLFPMEPPIYARHGVDARFVGHPLADAFPLEPDPATARAALGLPQDAPVLALLPGSRLGEIERLGPDFLAAARLLATEIPDLRIVAPMANEPCRAAFAALRAEVAGREAKQGAEPFRDERFLTPVGEAHLALRAADAVLLTSGTAALEAMLAKRPMVVAYRLAPLTYRLVRGLRLLKVERYALPNVLAGRALVPELMQDDCTPEALAAALAPTLRSRSIDPALLAEYRRQHRELARGASRSAAAAVAELVEERAGDRPVGANPSSEGTP
ncbi:MAG: lipid-A-disaccharide synthase [Xanthomonadales bacterium]|nr:lipid-A-disaccharide synthase [Xanthomonadales bacterium]